MTSIRRVYLLLAAMLGLLVGLTALAVKAQTPDYQWQLKLAEAEQQPAPEPPATTGTTPATPAPAGKPATVGVQWMEEREAKEAQRQTGQPICYLVTSRKNCRNCLVLESELDGEPLPAELAKWPCVEIDASSLTRPRTAPHPWLVYYGVCDASGRIDAKLEGLPVFVCVAADGRRVRFKALIRDARGHVDRTAIARTLALAREELLK